MMGPRQEAQGSLFYEFSIDDYVPDDHPLRAIDRFLDLSDVRSILASFYSDTGRPSIDPELLIRMLLLGYCQGIGSERRLCEEVHLNLAYRWFCKLDLMDPVPDHSTFSKNRYGRFRDSGIFRHLFENVLRRCIDEGLVGGEGFGVDASLIPANANQTRGVDGKKGFSSTWSPYEGEAWMMTQSNARRYRYKILAPARCLLLLPSRCRPECRDVALCSNGCIGEAAFQQAPTAECQQWAPIANHQRGCAFSYADAVHQSAPNSVCELQHGLLTSALIEHERTSRICKLITILSDDIPAEF